MTDQELIAEIKNHFATKDVRIENMGINNDKTCNILITIFNARKYKDIKDREEEEYLENLRRLGEI